MNPRPHQGRQWCSVPITLSFWFSYNIFILTLFSRSKLNSVTGKMECHRAFSPNGFSLAIELRILSMWQKSLISRLFDELFSQFFRLTVALYSISNFPSASCDNDETLIKYSFNVNRIYIFIPNRLCWRCAFCVRIFTWTPFLISYFWCRRTTRT